MQIFNKTNFCMLIMGFGKSADIAEIGENNVGSDVELGGNIDLRYERWQNLWE